VNQPVNLHETSAYFKQFAQNVPRHAPRTWVARGWRGVSIV